MIQLKRVSKVYDAGKNEQVTALQDINFEVERGEIYGIIGRSGAGKSTLLRLINGLEAPTQGSVRVDGQEISRLGERELREARKKIGMIFQHFNLLWSRTVEDNVAFPLEVAGKSKAEIKQKVGELLERVGLANKAKAYPAQLSGGQKQRVGIARALANDPHVLLCDEATSALDPETTQSILRLLKEINRDTGITTLLITHEMSVVEAVCRRVAVIDNGQIVESGKVDEIFRNPKQTITRQLIRQTLKREEEATETGTVLRLTFPRLSEGLARIEEEAAKHGVSFRIVQAEGTADHQHPLTLQLTGDNEKVQQSVEALKQAAEAEVKVVADV
ncbi:methionine import ATP-binding protein MetN [Marinithermofilum abyssi]|uniref:Methionine import ATP-binding protein MetN n=1 Tax=Marinithermofilum abyssi TaxID=1571185 RepID=A0A8J2VE25_9BACL|nr:ATP-binding cassette domain-containing protein [Marinithermofilum abyssi]GGE04942.1 methionine import ATP-binding protein MetN [Marinithermofilum abyssi]